MPDHHQSSIWNLFYNQFDKRAFVQTCNVLSDTLWTGRDPYRATPDETRQLKCSVSSITISLIMPVRSKNNLFVISVIM